jgi:hypothetical protein
VLGTSATSQGPALPKELSGRYLHTPSGATQTFSLAEIVATSEKTFSAKLTWWTRDPKCIVRSEPIVGKLTGSGLTFEAKTKCDVEFTAQLDRGQKEWSGSAKTTTGPEILLSLTAN